jgi:hypothetical protein
MSQFALSRIFLALVLIFFALPSPPARGQDLHQAPDTASSISDDAPTVTGSANKPQIRLNIPESMPYGGLTQVELARLASHDIVLMIDKSGSMGRTDCKLSDPRQAVVFSTFSPGPSGQYTSRWNWCLEQMTEMVHQTEQALPGGFSIVLFDHRFAIYPRANAQQLVDMFTENQPIGGTNLTQPLAATFADYFRRKSLSHGKIKPLVIGIITDGGPENPKSVREVIVSTIFQMRHPSDITVIFFLIGGHDPGGQAFIDFITISAIQAEGAPFNIVKSVSFEQLQQMGLARALAVNLQ